MIFNFKKKQRLYIRVFFSGRKLSVLYPQLPSRIPPKIVHLQQSSGRKLLKWTVTKAAAADANYQSLYKSPQASVDFGSTKWFPSSFTNQTEIEAAWEQYANHKLMHIEFIIRRVKTGYWITNMDPNIKDSSGEKNSVIHFESSPYRRESTLYLSTQNTKYGLKGDFTIDSSDPTKATAQVTMPLTSVYQKPVLTKDCYIGNVGSNITAHLSNLPVSSGAVSSNTKYELAPEQCPTRMIYIWDFEKEQFHGDITTVNQNANSVKCPNNYKKTCC